MLALCFAPWFIMKPPYWIGSCNQCVRVRKMIHRQPLFLDAKLSTALQRCPVHCQVFGGEALYVTRDQCAVPCDFQVIDRTFVILVVVCPAYSVVVSATLHPQEYQVSPSLFSYNHHVCLSVKASSSIIGKFDTESQRPLFHHQFGYCPFSGCRGTRNNLELHSIDFIG